MKQTAARAVQVADEPNFGRGTEVRPYFIPLAEDTQVERRGVVKRVVRRSKLAYELVLTRDPGGDPTTDALPLRKRATECHEEPADRGKRPLASLACKTRRNGETTR